jgi:hypothetical protein
MATAEGRLKADGIVVTEEETFEHCGTFFRLQQSGGWRLGVVPMTAGSL